MNLLVQEQEDLSLSIISALRNFKKDSDSRKNPTYSKNKLKIITVTWNKFFNNHRHILSLAESSPDSPYLVSDIYKKTRVAFEDLQERLISLAKIEDTINSESGSNSKPPPTPLDSNQGNPIVSGTHTIEPISILPIVNSFSYLKMNTATYLQAIPEFDGTSDPEVFVLKCELMFNLITEEAEGKQFITALKLRLKGEISSIILKGQYNTWTEIKGALLKNTKPIQSSESVRAQLAASRQNTQEDVQSFGRRIQSLHGSLIAAFDKELGTEVISDGLRKIFEKQTLSTFENGLRNERLQTMVVMNKSVSLAAAIDFATEQEFRFKKFSPESPTIRLNNNRNPFVTCLKCGKTGHYANNCTQNNPAIPYRVKREMEENSCSYCKNPGHHIQDCAARKRNNLYYYQSEDAPRNVRFADPNRERNPPQRFPINNSNTSNRNSQPQPQVKPSTSSTPYRNPFARTQVNLVAQPEAENSTPENNPNDNKFYSFNHSSESSNYHFRMDQEDQPPPGNL